MTESYISLSNPSRFFDFANPDTSVYNIADVAEGLSKQRRFLGYCRDYYSVAQHCVNASYAAPRALAMHALMHDASEAFMADIPSPLKQFLPDYRAIEKKVQAAIYKRMLLSPPTDEEQQALKQIDKWLLNAEKTTVKQNFSSWPSLVEPVLIEPFDIEHISFASWSQEDAYRKFLIRYDDLVLEQEFTVQKVA